MAPGENASSHPSYIPMASTSHLLLVGVPGFPSVLQCAAVCCAAFLLNEIIAATPGYRTFFSRAEYMKSPGRGRISTWTRVWEPFAARRLPSMSPIDGVTPPCQKVI